MRVTPAADMPLETVNNNGQIVIVNLQATPLDKYAFRINGMIDDVMKLLMEKLALDIPPFRLERRLAIRRVPASKDSKKDSKEALMIRGVDLNGDPYSLFPQLDGTFMKTKTTFSSKKDPFRIAPEKTPLDEGMLKLKLYFQGYYGEPPLDLEVNLADVSTKKNLTRSMLYDPLVTKKWSNIKYT